MRGNLMTRLRTECFIWISFTNDLLIVLGLRLFKERRIDLAVDGDALDRWRLFFPRLAVESGGDFEWQGQAVDSAEVRKRLDELTEISLRSASACGQAQDSSGHRINAESVDGVVYLDRDLLYCCVTNLTASDGSGVDALSVAQD